MWPFSTIRKLRAEVERLTEENKYRQDKDLGQEARITLLTGQVDALQAQLEQARRNDMPRDKNGRFVSKVANG